MHKCSIRSHICMCLDGELFENTMYRKTNGKIDLWFFLNLCLLQHNNCAWIFFYCCLCMCFVYFWSGVELREKFTTTKIGEKITMSCMSSPRIIYSDSTPFTHPIRDSENSKHIIMCDCNDFFLYRICIDCSIKQ